jgi:hypothetical protein
LDPPFATGDEVVCEAALLISVVIEMAVVVWVMMGPVVQHRPAAKLLDRADVSTQRRGPTRSLKLAGGGQEVESGQPEREDRHQPWCRQRAQQLHALQK